MKTRLFKVYRAYWWTIAFGYLNITTGIVSLTMGALNASSLLSPFQLLILGAPTLITGVIQVFFGRWLTKSQSLARIGILILALVAAIQVGYGIYGLMIGLYKVLLVTLLFSALLVLYVFAWLELKTYTPPLPQTES
jgi:hypothetical protein